MAQHTDDDLWVAATQAGYFTTAQALRIGYGARRVAMGLADGTLTRIQGDLIRITSWPRGPLDDYAKWCAWFESRAVVSHQSAAELHGLGSLTPRMLHLTVCGRRRPQTPQVAVSRRRLPDSDVEEFGAIRVTTPVRTVLDLAATPIAQRLLDEVVSDALAIGRLSADEIAGVLGACPVRVVDRVRHAIGA